MTIIAPALTVIVPAYRCAEMLRACVNGLMNSDLPREQWELIIVNDGSDDDTLAAARELCNHVLTIADGPRGPANARNVGALKAAGQILLFVDADVVVAPNTLSGFLGLFATTPNVSAAFGSYDDSPAASGFISQYRNLLHRHVHMNSPGAATTFWAGCGAVKREAFLAVGGFDAIRYARPQIEDIDLGYRLTDAGYRIVLAPQLEGKHLKRWTFANMVRTDFRDRAVPWMHLLMERKEAHTNGALNIGIAEKVYTVLVCLSAIFLMLPPFVHALRPAAAMMLLIVLVANWRLFTWFKQQRGLLFALEVVPLRVLYYLIGGAGAAWAIVTHRSRAARAPVAALEGSSRQPVAP